MALIISHFKKTIIFLLLSQLSLSGNTWEDFKDFTYEQMVDAAGGDEDSLRTFPPYRCNYLREVQKVIDDFTALYEKHIHFNQYLLGKAWTQMFYSSGKISRAYYRAKLDLKNVMFDLLLLKKDQNSQLNELDDSEMKISGLKNDEKEMDHIIGSVSDEKTKKELEFFEDPGNRFNYYLLGKLFGDFLFKEQFVCYTIPELSLLIFKIFHYNLFDNKYIFRFFHGFYNSLYEDQEDHKEAKVRNLLIEQFFVYNLKAILQIDQQFAYKLISLFDHRQSTEEMNDLVFNFSSLYAYFMKELDHFVHEHDGTVEGFIERFHDDKKKFFIDTAKEFGVFVSLFVYKMAIGMLMAKTGPISAFLGNQLSEANSYIEDKIKEKLGPKHPEYVKDFTEHLKGGNNAISTKSLENFVATFENNTKVFDSCPLCEVVGVFAEYGAFSNSPMSLKEEKLIL